MDGVGEEQAHYRLSKRAWRSAGSGGSKSPAIQPLPWRSPKRMGRFSAEIAVRRATGLRLRATMMSSYCAAWSTSRGSRVLARSILTVAMLTPAMDQA